MTVTALMDRTAAAADVFRLLSACYYEPEKKMLLEEDLFGQLRTALERCLPDQTDLADAMAASLETAPEQDLLVDYAKLFVGPDELLAHPYGSVYLDGPKILMGDSTMDVLRRYREAEFAMTAEFKDVPDHIAVELEFLYLLCYHASLALAEGRMEDHALWQQRRQSFIDEHIGRWIDAFCNKLRAKTQFDYYRNLADLSRNFLNAQKSVA
ncbi:MAG: molecular chaperone TorD family protein [Pelovirga sp.]